MALTLSKITLIQLTMKKGKFLTALVLILEIASIIILHAVKISQSEKTASKEISKNTPQEPVDAKQRPAYTLAAFR
jgi:large-conductance mechanosensitive channel